MIIHLKQLRILGIWAEVNQWAEVKCGKVEKFKLLCSLFSFNFPVFF